MRQTKVHVIFFRDFLCMLYVRKPGLNREEGRGDDYVSESTQKAGVFMRRHYNCYIVGDVRIISLYIRTGTEKKSFFFVSKSCQYHAF